MSPLRGSKHLVVPTAINIPPLAGLCTFEIFILINNIHVVTIYFFFCFSLIIKSSTIRLFRTFKKDISYNKLRLHRKKLNYRNRRIKKLKFLKEVLDKRVKKKSNNQVHLFRIKSQLSWFRYLIDVLLIVQFGFFPYLIQDLYNFNCFIIWNFSLFCLLFIFFRHVWEHQLFYFIYRVKEVFLQ